MGQMAYIPFSSFDPIFFLHHAMVDRVFAMWQVLYPDQWVKPQPAKMNSYTTSTGQIQDSKTPLTPFYATSNGTFWNSDMVRNPEVFGYTYEEITGASLSSGASNFTAKMQVIEAINRLYGGSSPSTLKIHSKRRTPKGPTFGKRSSAEALTRNIIDNNNQMREWTANIRVDKQALGGPFFVHLFLDPVARNSTIWSTADNLVGTMSIFAAPKLFNVKVQTNSMVTTGTVPLTSSLAAKVASGHLPGLAIEDVKHYLRQNLRICVVRSDGTPVDHKTVSGLGVRVVSALVQVPSMEVELPIWDPVDFGFDLV
jgi:tyrosinase